MAIGAKRKRPPPKGLPPGERLKRDKLAGAELYSQWGWVSRISDPSQITHEHRLAAYGFSDRLGKPICKNKYAESDEREPKKRKVDVAPKSDSSPVAVGEDADDIIVISSEDEEVPICNKKRCKDNPQCINYMGQVRLENQDSALQSFLELSHLGPSPLNNAREPDLPIGLKNLGATCYANAFIQVWFQDHAFRDGVYRCKPSQEEGQELEDSPIFQLQVTFAALQESTQNVFNPVKLVESLHLRASEQQDAQEFSKLFMSHLATEFEKQAVPSLKTLLADQFEGKQTYGTMCRKCHHRSERDTDFLELEINLEANGKLEERVEALLQSEELTDDNKYYCTRCDSLQDATRYTKLRRLPPVLHFSVLRFVFDLSTLSRKKSKQAIMFPSVLDMAPFVDGEAQNRDDTVQVQVPAKRGHSESEKPELESDMVYELRGVLLHKGPSAYHGHYEAQVFDVTTKQFYQFNDETVTPIASLQSMKSDKDAGENGTAAAEKGAAAKRRRTYARKKRRVDDSDAEESDIGTANNTRKVDPSSSYISSKDAYMLIYARRDAGLSHADTITNASRHLLPTPEPPLLARERVASLNKTHDIACAEYMEREAKLTEAFKFMRRKKMGIYRHWHIGDFREESVVVSRSALEDWLAKDIEKPKKKETPEGGSNANGRPHSSSRQSTPNVTDYSSAERFDPLDPLATPSAATPVADDLGHRLDNSAILCRHGALDPRKAGDMKRIKKDVLESIRIETRCFVEPEMTTEDVCLSCVKELFTEKRYALDHSSQVEQYDEFLESGNDIQGAWISKAWLRDWRQNKPKMHVAGEGDPPPDAPEYAAHVKCAHGQLSLSAATRKWINGEACTFLQSLFSTWCPMISRLEDPRTCSACDDDLSLSKETRQELKQRVDREKDKLKGLISSIALAMDPDIIPGVSYAIIPAEFLRQWRAWINRPQEKPRPGAIDNTWLLCKHDRLIIDPSVPQDLGTTVSLVLLTDWVTLQDLYGGGPLITITGLQQDSQGSEVAVTATHDFEVCQECRNDRLSNFETATISVRILGDEPDTTPERRDGLKDEDVSPDVSWKGNTNGPSGRKNGRPVRMSNRLRNSKRKAERRSITIQKLTTVRDIKIKLHNDLNIPTICQRLFFRGKELTDSLETVATLGILANDMLDLREEKENDDALNSDAELETSREPREEGRAFGGTILSGSKKANTSSEGDRHSSPEIVSTPNHCPVCTFINPDDLAICGMCGSKTDI